MKKSWKILLIVIGLIVFIFFSLVVLSIFTGNQQEKQKIVSEKTERIEKKPVNFVDLPTKTIEFKVKVPPNTPSNVYLMIRNFADSTSERIQMNKTSDLLVYSSKIELPEGALIKYFYDISSEGTPWGENMEKFSNDIEISFRHLYVYPGLQIVEDSVAQWIKTSSSISRGIIKGKVTDKATGEGVEAIVSVGGLHLITDYYGDFEIEDVPEGKQNIVVSTSLGDYKYGYKTVEVKRDEITEINFELEPAKKVSVTFNLEIPEKTAEEMPEWAVPKISGNIYQLGATRWQKNNLEWKVPDRYVYMKKSGERRFKAEIDLYEGTYVEYAYQIGTYEKNPYNPGSSLLRGFVVSISQPIRNDKLLNWKEEGVDYPLTFILEVPPNTPKTDKIFMDAGGAIVLDKISNDRYGLFMYHSTPYGMNYAYEHGISYIGLQGWEATKDDKKEHPRNFTVNNAPINKNEKVDRWRLYPESKRVSNNEPRKIKFSVSVPFNTPSNDKIYLKGNVPELAGGVEMKKLSETLFEKEIIFDSLKNVEYEYTHGNLSKSDGKKRTMTAEYDGQFVIDKVNSWQDLSFSYPKKIIGVQLNDYWTPNFLDLLPSTLDHLKDNDVEWVNFVVIWNYAKIGSKTKLTPIIPSTYAGNSIYPTQDITSVLKEIKKKEMKVILEASIVGDSNLPLNEQIKENEKFALYLADIAQEANADMVVLSSVLDNEAMKNLIKTIREKYSGKIAVNGFSSGSFEFDSYDYPVEADYVIYNYFENLDITNKKEEIFIDETGERVCCLWSADASVLELKNAMEKSFENLKKAYDKYHKPIIFNQIGFASFDGASFNSQGGFAVDSFYEDRKEYVLDLTEQSDLYEAFFQTIKDKDWIAGGFSFGYTYTDFPLSKSYDIRSKPAEATLSKYAYMTGIN